MKNKVKSIFIFTLFLVIVFQVFEMHTFATEKDKELSLEVETNDQVLSASVSSEEGKNIITVIHDYWSKTGAVDGTRADKSNLEIVFKTSEGAAVERVDGKKLAETKDYSVPFEVKVQMDGDANVFKMYEVRVVILITPIRIPGINDATGTLGMKFFADPDIFVDDNGKYYMYPTTDGHALWKGWQIRCFESDDLVTWEDKGIMIDLQDQNLDGVKDTDILPNRSMRAWAPGIAKRDGKYFLYFSGRDDSDTSASNQSNVAVSDRPDGGFVLQPVKVTSGIDPAAFKDPQTGKWYLTWGQSNARRIAELNDDMISVKSSGQVTPVATRFNEGAYLHARKYKGEWTYYFTYSVDDTNNEGYSVHYSTAPAITGPWTYRGAILQKDSNKGILGTGHHSIIQVPGTDDWYIVYHCFLTDSMRPRLFDQVENIQIRTGNKREVRIARLTFSEPNSGTPLIEPVQVTYEGVPAERVPKVSVNGVSQHGTAEVGTKLTAIFNETWEEDTWQWYRDGIPVFGATKKEYVITSEDEGSQITVKGTARSATGVRQNGKDELSLTNELESQVVRIAGCEAKTAVINAGSQPSELQLPKTVNIFMSDGTKSTVSVEWNTVTAAQLANPNELLISGIAEGKKTRLYLSVRGPAGVRPISIATPVNTKPVMPGLVDVIWTDGSVEKKAVQWDDVQETQLNAIGTFSVHGVVKGYPAYQAVANIRVGIPAEIIISSPANGGAVADASAGMDVGYRLIDDAWDQQDAWNNTADGQVSQLSDWIVLRFDKNYTINKASIYFWKKAYQLPHEVKIEYLNESKQWIQVSGLRKNKDFVLYDPVDFTFDPIRTEQLRFTFSVTKYDTGLTAIGVSEIRVYSNVVQQNKTAQLEDLKVGGTTVSGFSADRYHYTVLLKEGEQIPQVTASGKENATYFIRQALTGNSLAIVEAVSEDGQFSKNYTVQFKQINPEQPDEPEKPEPDTNTTEDGTEVPVTVPNNQVPKKNTTCKIGYLWYKVTKSAAKGGTVMVTKATTKTRKTILVPNTVKIKGYTFRVTKIGKKAFQNNKKLRTVTIGKEVVTIESRAFYKAKALRKITIKSGKLKTVKKKAFSGISRYAVIDVPNKKLNSYKKLLRKKGQANTVKIK